MNLSLVQRIAAVVAAVATPIVIVAIAILLFLNPIWVNFEQDRSAVDRFTGFSQAEVHQVTNSILSDLAFGPPAFDVGVNGQPVLDPRERSHMADVATVFHQLGLLALAALVALVVIGLWSRGRRWFWRAVGAGASVLAVAVIAVGIAFTLFFDQAFTLLHDLFFAAGTWEFNPATERLVQLFPDQFWTETVTGVVIVVLVLAALVALVGRARAQAAVGNARLIGTTP